MKMEVAIPISRRRYNATIKYIKARALSKPPITYRAYDPSVGHWVSMSRIPQSQPRLERRQPGAFFDPFDGNPSDDDYSPDQEIFVVKFAEPPLPKRRREPSPASSSSSISLGTVRYTSPKRQARQPSIRDIMRDTAKKAMRMSRKGKERAYKSPGPTRDNTPLSQAELDSHSTTPYDDSGYISDSDASSADSSFEEDDRAPWADSVHDTQENDQWAERTYTASNTSGEYEDDRHIENMMDLEPGDQASGDSNRSESPYLDQSSPAQPPTENTSFSQSRSPSTPPAPDVSNQAGPSTGPGTREWYKARQQPLDEDSRQVSPELTQSTSAGKQVMFASEDNHSEADGSEEMDRQVLFRPRSASVSSVRFVTPTFDRPPSGLREGTPCSRGSGRPKTTDKDEWFTQLEAELTQTPQTPRRTLISQAPPKSSEVSFISRVGLGVVLEMLATKYGLSPDVVEQVYSVEDGIEATETVLQMMKDEVEKILFRRASSVIRDDSQQTQR